MDSEIRLKFLGIRSIHDAPSTANAIYGGNTHCILLQDRDQIFLVNAGFGSNSFGDEMVRAAQIKKTNVRCHLFLNDFLWDSIMGFPLFTPVHFKSTEITIHSAVDKNTAQDRLSSICANDVSPFRGVKSLSAKLEFPDPTSERQVGDWTVSLVKLAHPMAPYPSAIWIFKHQNGLRIAFSPHAPTNNNDRKNMLKNIKHCDVLVQSAIAPAITHPTMAGRWTFAEALQFGQDAKVGHTFITGMHPSLNDRQLMQAEIDLCTKTGLQSGIDFSFAREWSQISLPFPLHQKKVG